MLTEANGKQTVSKSNPASKKRGRMESGKYNFKDSNSGNGDLSKCQKTRKDFGG